MLIHQTDNFATQCSESLRVGLTREGQPPINSRVRLPEGRVENLPFVDDLDAGKVSPAPNLSVRARDVVVSRRLRSALPCHHRRFI